jgi:hypothetical protein
VVEESGRGKERERVIKGEPELFFSYSSMNSTETDGIDHESPIVFCNNARNTIKELMNDERLPCIRKGQGGEER